MGTGARAASWDCATSDSSRRSGQRGGRGGRPTRSAPRRLLLLRREAQPDLGSQRLHPPAVHAAADDRRNQTRSDAVGRRPGFEHWPNAYAFGDEVIARDTSLASGRPRHGYVNGISDYSLWWVINNGFLQRYFGGTKQATRRRAADVHRFLSTSPATSVTTVSSAPESRLTASKTLAGTQSFWIGASTPSPGETSPPSRCCGCGLCAPPSTCSSQSGTQSVDDSCRLADRSTETLIDQAWDRWPAPGGSIWNGLAHRLGLSELPGGAQSGYPVKLTGPGCAKCSLTVRSAPRSCPRSPSEHKESLANGRPRFNASETAGARCSTPVR